MSICLIHIADGREQVHEQAWTSMALHLELGLIDQVVSVDDRDHTLGFAGAVQHAWDQVQTEWVFHLEMDFTFNVDVDLLEMIDLLKRRPYLAQVALKRQAWNHEERAAGGIVEQHPDDYVEIRDDCAVWTEHRRFFTTNPSVYNARLCRIGWPQVPHSEGIFTHTLLRDPLLRFAFWGGKFDEPRVHHVGEHRAGTGY